MHHLDTVGRYLYMDVHPPRYEGDTRSHPVPPYLHRAGTLWGDCCQAKTVSTSYCEAITTLFGQIFTTVPPPGPRLNTMGRLGYWTVQYLASY